MRDLVLSFLIGSTVLVGATESAGITHMLDGQAPTAAVRRVVGDVSVPAMPALPQLPDIGSLDPRSLLSGAASPTPSAVPGASSAASPEANGKMRYIAHTNGTGVRARPECLDAVLGATGVAEGAAVELVRVGGGECPGWALVRSGGTDFWVRMAYLDASPPRQPESPLKGNAVSRATEAPPVDQGPATKGNAGARGDEGKPPPEDKDDDKGKGQEKRPEQGQDKPQSTASPSPTPAASPPPSATPSPTATPPTATPSPTPGLSDEENNNGA